MDGPCGWPTDGCIDCATNHPDDVWEAALAMATSILWSATGRRWGVCEVTVRPCNERWRGLCGCRPHACSCGPVPEIPLPGPVYAVSDVSIDGESLDPCAYRVDGWRWLVRVDGERWPACQDLLADGITGGWSVTYQQGFPPPAGAGLAVTRLACEIAKALCDDQSCQLPANVTRVVRQGVTVDVAAQVDGKTGIPTVDLWAQTANRPIMRPHLQTPDFTRPRQTTWTCDDSPGESP